MKILQTEQEQKSFLYTAISFVVIILLLFLLKFTNEISISDLEGGGGGGDIAVNFGDSDFGQGDNFTNVEKVSAAPKPTQTPVSSENEILTTDNIEAPAIAAVKKVEKAPKAAVATPIPAKPKPSKSATDALNDLLNGSDKGGDGNDNQAGNKGKASGTKGATGYEGGGGSGTGSGGGNGSGQGIGTGSGYGSGSGAGRGNGNGDYLLGNRKALTKPQPNYICNEQGKVVVEISVDKTGKVVSANAGARGTTNAARCLLDQAKIAAMNTRWQADANAPATQVGKIVYNFKLTD